MPEPQPRKVRPCLYCGQSILAVTNIRYCPSCKELRKQVKPLIGIYRMYNLINGKSYVGQSVNIRSRWQGHLCDLREGRHNRLLQADCDLHGINAFEFEILELLDSKDPSILSERELYWVRHHRSNEPEHGYNLDEVGSHSGLETLHVRLPAELLQCLTSAYPLRADRDQFVLEVLQQALKFRSKATA
jgi:hypothetical protein